MRLRRESREFYDLTITTDPPVVGWEASFDSGETWHDGELVDVDDPEIGALRQRWLVAGTEADDAGAVAVITRSISPLLRASDDPELVVRRGPTIYV
jgi:hypothetical protein